MIVLIQPFSMNHLFAILVGLVPNLFPFAMQFIELRGIKSPNHHRREHKANLLHLQSGEDSTTGGKDAQYYQVFGLGETQA